MWAFPFGSPSLGSPLSSLVKSICARRRLFGEGTDFCKPLLLSLISNRFYLPSHKRTITRMFSPLICIFKRSDAACNPSESPPTPPEEHWQNKSAWLWHLLSWLKMFLLFGGIASFREVSMITSSNPGGPSRCRAARTSYLWVLPCLIYRQQSFWLIRRHVLPVWTLGFHFHVRSRGSFSSSLFPSVPLIGNNELAHCIWHRLSSIQLETIHSLIRIISKLPLCKSLGHKFTHWRQKFFLQMPKYM